MRAKRKATKSMLTDVVSAVESMVKTAPSLRDDPKVKEMTTLMLAGRAAERMDITSEVERRYEALVGLGKATLDTAQTMRIVERKVLLNVLGWLRERDERANR
jgi:hypothetical protein